MPRDGGCDAALGPATASPSLMSQTLDTSARLSLQSGPTAAGPPEDTGNSRQDSGRWPPLNLVPPAQEPPGQSLPGGQDHRFAFGDGDGVLAVRAAGAVLTAQGPPVRVGEDLIGAGHEPRLDRDHQPRAQL